MPLLYYWRKDNYQRDLDMGAGYHLNQANPLMHQIKLGDSLWAFTRNKKGQYVLAAELVVRAKTFNPPNFRYGAYRIWGDIYKSRYFDINEQYNMEQVIRRLSCTTNAKILGRSFQGHRAVKKITLEDHFLLGAVAEEIPIEPRAHLLPEEELEATLLFGDADKVRYLIQEENSGIAERRQTYLYSQAPSRNRKLVDELQLLYDGRCQICSWSPKDIYETQLCEGHHIHWLSRGGEDVLENMVLVCPNHHAAIHKCDAPLDYADLTFDFIIRKEALQLNFHLGQYL